MPGLFPRYQVAARFEGHHPQVPLVHMTASHSFSHQKACSLQKLFPCRWTRSTFLIFSAENSIQQEKQVEEERSPKSGVKEVILRRQHFWGEPCFLKWLRCLVAETLTFLDPYHVLSLGILIASGNTQTNMQKESQIAIWCLPVRDNCESQQSVQASWALLGQGVADLLGRGQISPKSQCP